MTLLETSFKGLSCPPCAGFRPGRLVWTCLCGWLRRSVPPAWALQTSDKTSPPGLSWTCGHGGILLHHYNRTFSPICFLLVFFGRLNYKNLMHLAFGCILRSILPRFLECDQYSKLRKEIQEVLISAKLTKKIHCKIFQFLYILPKLYNNNTI